MENKIQFRLKTKNIGRGMLSILVQAKRQLQSVDIDTGVHVFIDEWDDDNGMVVDNPNSKKLNGFIRKTIYDLETFEFESDGGLSLSRLKKTYENKELAYDFYLMVEKAIPTRDTHPNTQANHYQWLKKIKRFKETCFVHELTEDLVQDFYKWLCRHNWSEATIKKDMQTLKVYWNHARKLYGSKVPDDCFDWYKPGFSRAFTMKGLNDDDIRLIENFVSRPGIKGNEKLCMEQFLFMSYTGCRYSDFCSLSEDNFVYDNGKLWLTYVSVKTSTNVHIPLFALFDGRAEQIYVKHKDNLEDFFKIQCNGHYNQIIKRVAKRIGITKRVTCHVARHTCATRLINRDVPITTIQKIIGHRQLRMTMQYAHTSDDAMVRQLGK